MSILRLNVEGQATATTDEHEVNREYSASLGLPELLSVSPEHGRPLAICGGGPSLRGAVNVLRNWPGDIWAINGVCAYLASLGIKSTFVTVDADSYHDDLVELDWMLGPVKKALVSSFCNKALLDRLKGAEVMLFHPGLNNAVDLPAVGGTTTASRIPIPAIMLGYRLICYVGCECSFTAGAPSHAYKHDAKPRNQLVIRADGKDWVTTLQLMLQAKELSFVISEYPRYFSEKSGGLLRAMLKDPKNWKVVAANAEMHAELSKQGAIRDTMTPFDVAQAVGAHVPKDAGRATVEEIVRAVTPSSWRA